MKIYNILCRNFVFVSVVLFRLNANVVTTVPSEKRGKFKSIINKLSHLVNSNYNRSELRDLQDKIEQLTNLVTTLENENMIYRETASTYKNMLINQKQQKINKKSELLNLQIKLQEISESHPQGCYVLSS